MRMRRLAKIGVKGQFPRKLLFADEHEPGSFAEYRLVKRYTATDIEKSEWTDIEGLMKLIEKLLW